MVQKREPGPELLSDPPEYLFLLTDDCFQELRPRIFVQTAKGLSDTISVHRIADGTAAVANCTSEPSAG